MFRPDINVIIGSLINCNRREQERKRAVIELATSLGIPDSQIDFHWKFDKRLPAAPFDEQTYLRMSSQGRPQGTVHVQSNGSGKYSICVGTDAGRLIFDTDSTVFYMNGARYDKLELSKGNITATTNGLSVALGQFPYKFAFLDNHSFFFSWAPFIEEKIQEHLAPSNPNGQRQLIMNCDRSGTKGTISFTTTVKEVKSKNTPGKMDYLVRGTSSGTAVYGINPFFFPKSSRGFKESIIDITRIIATTLKTIWLDEGYGEPHINDYRREICLAFNNIFTEDELKAIEPVPRAGTRVIENPIAKAKRIDENRRKATEGAHEAPLHVPDILTEPAGSRAPKREYRSPDRAAVKSAAETKAAEKPKSNKPKRPPQKEKGRQLNESEFGDAFSQLKSKFH